MSDPTEPGWYWGRHRLICGDSTDADVVERLLDGVTPTMVFADPPYGVDYKVKATASDGNTISQGRREMAERSQGIENDATDAEALSVTRAALALLDNAGAFYVCTDWRHVERVGELLPIEAKACIVWDKGGPYQHLDLWAKGHELLVYAGPYGGQATSGVDVWSIHREFRHDHPTPKPVALVAKAIEASSEPGASIADPFAGSGPTFIAAEQLGRTCFGIELSEAYCDVVVGRFLSLWPDAAVTRERKGKVRPWR